MTDFDIIIKGGTIVDGTRTPRYVSDLAIKNGKIAQIGGLKGKTPTAFWTLRAALSRPALSTCTRITTRRFSGIPIARFPGGTGSRRWPWVIAGSGSPRRGSRIAIGRC